MELVMLATLALREDGGKLAYEFKTMPLLGKKMRSRTRKE